MTTPPSLPITHSPADTEKAKQAAAEEIFSQFQLKFPDDQGLSTNFQELSDQEKQDLISKIKNNYLQTDPSGAVFVTLPMGALYNELTGNHFMPGDNENAKWPAFDHNIFWFEGDTFKSQRTTSDQERDKVIGAVALYNIGQLTDAQYSQQGLTFTAYGIPWFNTPHYKTIMAKETPTKQDELDFEQIANYIQANSTGTKQEYLLEQLIMHSMHETTVYKPDRNDPDYSPDAATTVHKKYTLSPAFIALTEQYDIKINADLKNAGVIEIYDETYKKNEKDFNNRLATNGFLTAISYNCKQLTMQMDWWQPGEFNKTGERKTTEDFLSGSSLVDVKYEPFGVGLPNFKFIIPKEFSGNFISIKDSYFRVYLPANAITDLAVTELRTHLEASRKNLKSDFLGIVGNNFIKTVGGDQWKAIQKLPAEAFEELLKGVPGAGMAYGITSDTVKAMIEIHEHNAFLDVLNGNLDISKETKTLQISGQLTINADGTHTINARHMDRAQLDYNLYQFHNRYDDASEREASQLLWKEALEYYNNGTTPPNNGYLHNYWAWTVTMGTNLPAKWGRIQENIQTYNRTILRLKLPESKQKDIAAMTPEEIQSFLDQLDDFNEKVDSNQPITEADLID